jgi:hypothetical protein
MAAGDLAGLPPFPDGIRGHAGQARRFLCPAEAPENISSRQV